MLKLPFERRPNPSALHVTINKFFHDESSIDGFEQITRPNVAKRILS
jgi:hypothetical protein